MIDRTMNRRRLLQVSVGGVAAATLALPTPSAMRGAPARRLARQAAPADLAYRGEVEFWDWEFAPRQQAVEELIGQWQQTYPDITIKYTVQTYEDAGTKLLTAATAGEGPPFSNVHFYWRVDLQRAGVLVPYPADLFNFDELISTPFTRDPRTGDIYTSLFANYTDQVYFHTPLLEEQGIAPTEIPRRWDDFMKLAVQLTKRNGDRLEQAGWTFNHYYSREWLWTTMIYQQGGFLYSEDGTQALWNSDEAVQALQMIQDVYHVHKVDDPDFLGMFDAWGNRVAAMYVSQGYTGAGWNTDYPELEGQWGTAVTPTFTGNPTPAWGLMTPEEGFCVFTSAPPEVQAVAFAFIRDLLGTDEQRVRWAVISNGPPDKQALFAAPELATAPGNSIATQAETLPYRINYGERPLEAEQIWRTMFDEIILNKANVRAAATTATEQMNAVLADSGKERLFTERAYTPPAQ